MSLNRHLDKDDRQMTKRLKKVSNISSHQGIDSLERGKGLVNGGRRDKEGNVVNVVKVQDVLE